MPILVALPIFSVSFLIWDTLNQTKNFGIHKSLPGIKQSLDLLPVLLMQAIYSLFTWRGCCCLMFYLASTVTPGSYQQFAPSLHSYLRLFYLNCRSWCLSLMNFVRLLLIQSPGFWKVPLDCYFLPSAPQNLVLSAKIANVYLPSGYRGFKHKVHTQKLRFNQSMQSCIDSQLTSCY